MDAAFHEKVLAFIEYYKAYIVYRQATYHYLKQIDILNYNENRISNFGYYRMTKYNDCLSLIIIKFILLILEKPHDYFLNSFKPIFCDLVANIMKNNYYNIRHDITFNLIFSHSRNDIDKFIKSDYFNLLARINPDKYNYWYGHKEEKQRAEYLYDIQTKLQTAWIWAIIGAQIRLVE